MRETDLRNGIVLAHSHGPTRLWRQSAGMAWVGRVKKRFANGDVLLEAARAITMGIDGMSDLGGITTGGIAVQIEVKLPGHNTNKDRLASQLRWISICRSLGARAGMAESIEEARDIIDGRA